MFDSWNAWQWVAAAWLELILAYGGYLWYLRRRARRSNTDVEEES